MSNYVIVDLEMCNVPKIVPKTAYGCKHEIIQIGAVLVNEALETVDEFVSFVKPEFGVIDTYIEKLTGIKTKDLCNAPKLKDALDAFISWLPDNAVMVSWSENDECQLRKETETKGLINPELNRYLDNWVDCQKTFGKKMDNDRSYKLSEALIIANVDYDDGEHDALVDAKNTARLFIKMEREEVLTLSPYLSGYEDKSTYCPFAKLLAGYKSAC